MSALTKAEKLIRALQKGPMSEKQIINRLNIPNPRASVWYLRAQGHIIDTDQSGRVTKYYAYA